MKAYHYNEDKFFDMEMNCQIDPLESKLQGKTIYLMPANSTLEQPTAIDNSKPRWDGSKWIQYPDDKIVYGYTENEDGTINYIGENHLQEELQRIHKDKKLLFTDTKPVNIENRYWLSKDDEDYIAAKKIYDKEQALNNLRNQYEIDKTNIQKSYDEAVLINDVYMQEELKRKLNELIVKYDKDKKELENNL